MVLRDFAPGRIAVRLKDGGDPVTAADHAVNNCLLQILPKNGEGWLSEETADNLNRLQMPRVWVVDPLDGTREFIEGIPEWCVSVGLVEDGQAVAGGVYNVASGEKFLGSIETGILFNNRRTSGRATKELKDALVLASRSEMKRGEWARFQSAPFAIRPVGSVAYKLACVAAGLADATWTFVPKHEWDVAAGAALVLAAGGTVKTLRGLAPIFNQARPRFEGLVALGAGSEELFREMADEWWVTSR